MKSSSSSARVRKLLSTPKKMSPSGSSLVRIAWFSAAPASPEGRILTAMPVSAVNSSRIVSDTAKLSWVTMVNVTVGVDFSDFPQPAAHQAEGHRDGENGGDGEAGSHDCSWT